MFSYSQEEGTVAADLPEQIDTQIKEERFHELMSLQAQISEDMHHNMEDMILEVLVEGCDEENPDLVFGRSYKEAPNIDGSIFVENAGSVQAGEFIKVKILQGFTYRNGRRENLFGQAMGAKQMIVEIVNTGTELLLGEILNTNFHVLITTIK